MALHVWVVPGAARPGIVGVHGSSLKVRVASPPEAGRANDELKKQLEGVLGFPLSMVRGKNSRAKVFELSVSDPELARRKLGLAG